MVSLDFLQQQRKRVADYLRSKGYPVDDMPEDGVSEEGYEVFLKDPEGKRIIAWNYSPLRSKKYPWKRKEHWREVCRIWMG